MIKHHQNIALINFHECQHWDAVKTEETSLDSRANCKQNIPMLRPIALSVQPLHLP